MNRPLRNRQSELRGQLWSAILSAALVSCLLWLMLLLVLVSWPAVSHFWPSTLYVWHTEQGPILGQIARQRKVSGRQLLEGGRQGVLADEQYQMLLLDPGLNHDFQWRLAADLLRTEVPESAMRLVLHRQGQLFVLPQSLLTAQVEVPLDDPQFLGLLQQHWQQEQQRSQEASQLQTRDLLSLNQQLNQLDSFSVDYAEKLQAFERLRAQLLLLRQPQSWLLATTGDGEQLTVALMDVQYWQQPNQLRWRGKLGQFFHEWRRFLFSWPSLGHTQGGVWPALVGTVVMTLIMTVMVVPMGVLAGLYLHEYAQSGPWRRLLHIVVYNLAGIPAIVYGVFGLGLFIYVLGAQFDSWWFAAALPRPTLGTPGLFWVSLTLALLTLPVVIVNTEEGLARIPEDQRHACYALGLSKGETLLHLIVPLARPAILTGMILAIARAAGEVAPVMLVGVVRSVSQLPVDAQFPYVHLERKVMHLAYHIYDLGFQSANIEAGRPLVFASALTLVLIVLLLNLTAVRLRHRLRESFRQQQEG